MDVVDIQKQARRDAKTDVSFYNPSLDDIEITYLGNTYIIPAVNIVTYKKPLADFIKNKIAYHILYKKGDTATEQKLKEIYDKMENYDTQSESTE